MLITNKGHIFFYQNLGEFRVYNLVNPFHKIFKREKGLSNILLSVILILQCTSGKTFPLCRKVLVSSYFLFANCHLRYFHVTITVLLIDFNADNTFKKKKEILV